MAGDLLTGTFYLCLSLKEARWPSLRARLATKKPSLSSGEVAIELNVKVPLVLFQRPTLRAEIAIPAADAGQAVITADVADNIAAILTEQLGIRVEVAARG